MESLAATIHNVVPKLVPNPPGVEAISVPVVKQEKSESALPLVHASTWNETVDVTGWYLNVHISCLS